MPSFDRYKKNIAVRTNGQARKHQAAQIVEATWNEDINHQVGWLFDYYHDPCTSQLHHFEPNKCRGLIPIDVKYLRESSQTYEKDNVTYRIELRPYQEINVPYYNEFFVDTYDALFPVALYILLQDAKGVWRRWLIVSPANIHDSQFQTFEILECNYIFQYIWNDKKYQIAGVGRSQNSYNKSLLRYIGIYR